MWVSERTSVKGSPQHNNKSDLGTRMETRTEIANRKQEGKVDCVTEAKDPPGDANQDYRNRPIVAGLKKKMNVDLSADKRDPSIDDKNPEESSQHDGFHGNGG